MQQKLGHHAQDTCVSGHLRLVICCCDNVAHSVERGGQDLELAAGHELS